MSPDSHAPRAVLEGHTDGIILEEVEVIIGARLDPSLQNRIKVMAILTGVDKRDAGAVPNKSSKFDLKEIQNKFDIGVKPKEVNKWEIPLVR